MFARGLRCTGCGLEHDLGPYLRGCPTCHEVLEVVYKEAAIRSLVSFEMWARRSASVWRFAELLPLPTGGRRVTLGEGGTPIIQLPRTERNPLPFLYLQNETVNPTFSFKDRLNSVAISMARRLGFDRLVCSTTGNHGMSAAAYATRAGMECTVLVDPRTPAAQRARMRMFGATVIVESDHHALLQTFVEDHGWFPSSGIGAIPVPTPYGIEGYKTLAYEAVMALGRVPDHYVIPASRGDGLYGVWKGFRELRRLGLADTVPRMHGVQASEPDTVAVSIAGGTPGRVALRAIGDSGGTAVGVSDAAIVEAVYRAARTGVSAEPAGAASLAGAWKLADQGVIDPGEFVVCCITGAGSESPVAVTDRAPGEELVSPGDAELAGLMSGN